MAELNTMANHCVNTPRLIHRAVESRINRMHETAQRLYQAAESVAGLTMPAKVAIALGESQQTLKHWEKRGVSQRGIVRACELWGLSAAWLKDGVPPMLGASHPVTKGTLFETFDHPSLTKEELMRAEGAPARFVFALEDDAMRPYGGQGVEVLFHAAADAKIGAGVLVKDKQGEIHVRRKAQGSRPGHWLAVAPNPVYRSLDSDTDGLELIAVWRGVVNRGLEDV